MSNENQETVVPSVEHEQIMKQSSTKRARKTRTQSVPGQRPKDSKKVASGKKLAEHNKREKEALNKELKREAELKEEGEASNSWIPNLSFTTVQSIVGVGLTIFDLYMRHRTNTANEDSRQNKANEIQHESLKSMSDIEPVHKEFREQSSPDPTFTFIYLAKSKWTLGKMVSSL